MKTEKVNPLFEKIKQTNMRLTGPRKAIIEILQGRHLTLNEIYEQMKLMGHHNLSTVYNNIEALLHEKIVTEVYISGKTHYDLAIEDQSHDADAHIHVACKVDDHIIEINHSDVIDMIKAHPVFQNFKIDSIKLVVEGMCPSYEQGLCDSSEHCYLKTHPNEQK
jgi:Fe2+ or Zn2+ uptake regulation protein